MTLVSPLQPAKLVLPGTVIKRSLLKYILHTYINFLVQAPPVVGVQIRWSVVMAPNVLENLMEVNHVRYIVGQKRVKLQPSPIPHPFPIHSHMYRNVPNDNMQLPHFHNRCLSLHGCHCGHCRHGYSNYHHYWACPHSQPTTTPQRGWIVEWLAGEQERSGR